MFHTLNGFKLVECQLYTVKVKRNWKERLFTMPWRPWQRFKDTLEPVVPHGEFIVDKRNMIIYGTATTLNELIYSVNKEGK